MNKPIDDPISGRTTGGCLCGQVRYSFGGAPLLTAICHCRNCQRQSGSAFSIVTAVPESDFDLGGETRTFEDKSEGGRPVARVFCPSCGSPMYSTIEPMPGMIFIKGGTLDDPAMLQPSVEVFCDRTLPFLPALADTERHAGSNV